MQLQAKLNLGPYAQSLQHQSCVWCKKQMSVYLDDFSGSIVYWFGSSISYCLHRATCVFLDVVIKKDTALMYIMTTANVISLYCSGMEIGSATHTRFFLLVFPVRAPIKNKYEICCSFVCPWNGTAFGSWLFATIFMIFLYFVAPWLFGFCKLKLLLRSPFSSSLI